MKMRRVTTGLATLGGLGICLLLAGCSDSVPAGPKYADPVPVSGIVTLDGKPLENARVNFSPTGRDMLTAYGTTDATGKFALETGSGPDTKKGAIPGEYKVSVSSLVKPDGSRVVYDPKTPPAMQLAHESLPARYSQVSDTLLQASVKAPGVADLKFELTSQ